MDRLVGLLPMNAGSATVLWRSSGTCHRFGNLHEFRCEITKTRQNVSRAEMGTGRCRRLLEDKFRHAVRVEPPPIQQELVRCLHQHLVVIEECR